MAKSVAARTDQQRERNAPPAPILYDPSIGQEYGISSSVWPALVDAVFPLAKSVEGVKLALAYCKARKLDPFKKVCHIVPMYSTKLRREVETVWPGIAELRTTAFRTGLYAGCDPTEFGPVKTFNFEGEEKREEDGREIKKKVKVAVQAPEWCRVTVYRIVAGTRVAFPGPTIYFLAAYGKKSRWTNLPTEKWERTPSYMLEKVAEAAALRKAFPEELGDWSSADEVAAGLDIDGGPIVEHVAERQDESGASDTVIVGDESGDGEPGGEGNGNAGSGSSAPKLIELIDPDGVVLASHPGMTAWANDLEARLNELGPTPDAEALYRANRETLETISTRAAKSGAADLAETCKRIAIAFAFPGDEPGGSGDGRRLV